MTKSRWMAVRPLLLLLLLPILWSPECVMAAKRSNNGATSNRPRATTTSTTTPASIIPDDWSWKVPVECVMMTAITLVSLQLIYQRESCLSTDHICNAIRYNNNKSSSPSNCRWGFLLNNSGENLLVV